MALRLPPSLVPLSLGFCSFSFSADAQPRDCASFLLRSFKGPEPGARTHPRPGAPLSLPLGPPCPLTPHADPTELAAARAAPSGGRGGRSSSPSRRLERHAGTRRLAAGGAKLHTRRLLLPRRGREFVTKACLLGHSIPFPLVRPHLPLLSLSLFSTLPLPLSCLSLGPHEVPSGPQADLDIHCAPSLSSPPLVRLGCRERAGNAAEN